MQIASATMSAAGIAVLPARALASALDAAPAPETTVPVIPGAAERVLDPTGGAGGLVELLSNFFNIVGAEWVLWILLGLSVLSIFIIFDRIFYLRRRKGDNDRLATELDKALREGGPDKAMPIAKATPSLSGTAVATALQAYADGPKSVEEAVAGVIGRERAKYERGLAFLGTLGNNAPFIGLFGTVLGIIRAFADLAKFGAAAGAAAVMTGIAEALVATAVGLLVAIPAVMAYNYFQRTIKGEVDAAKAMTHVLLARMVAEPRGDGAGSLKELRSVGTR